MPRTLMTIRTRPGAYDTVPLLVAAPDAFDFTNQMSLAINGQVGLEVNNPTAGPITVTVHSAALPGYNRTGDITTFSIPAGQRAIFQEFPVVGWNSGGGSLMNIDASATGLTYLAIQRALGT